MLPADKLFYWVVHWLGRKVKISDMGTIPSTVPMSSMSTPAALDPAQFSLRRHGHPVQNSEIFFVSKSVGEVISKKVWNPDPKQTWNPPVLDMLDRGK